MPFSSKATEDSTIVEEENFKVIKLKKTQRILGRLWQDNFTIHCLYNKFITRKIVKILNRLNCENITIINFQYNFSEIFDCEIFKKKIYICNDEFTKKGRFNWQNKLFNKYEKLTAEKADLCLAVSTVLKSKLMYFNKNVNLFYPGHEFIKYKKYLRKSLGSEITSVCFMGYINKRINFNWLLKLVEDDRFRLTLVGEIQTDSLKNIQNLNRFNNFKHINSIFGDTLFDELCNHDVLIIPYDINMETVKAINVSNKFYQYLATGKPIVISNMPNFIKLDEGLIYRACDASDFVHLVKFAHESDTEEYFNRRLQFASDNTWQKRGEFLHEVIE